MVPGASYSQFESAGGLPGRSGSMSLTPRVDLGFYGGYLGLQSHGGAPGSNARRASIASDSIVASEDVDGDPNATYIWGTNLTVARVMSRFNAFVKGFEEEDTGEQKYMKLLIESRRRGDVSYNIDARHIFSFDPTLYQWTLAFPVETVPIFDYQLALITCEVEGAIDPESLDSPLQTRVYNLKSTKVIRDLDPSDIGTLVSVSGMVTRSSSIIPDQSLACFRCTKCSHEAITRNDRGNIDEPSKCPNGACQAKFSMQLVYNCSAFVDKQMLKVQEAPNDIPEGETPHTVTMFTRQDLVDAVKPGDRVKVVGIYRAQPVRVNPRGREVKSIYKTFIDVMHVEKDGSHDDMFSLMLDEVGAGETTVSNTSNMIAEEVQAKKQKFHEIASAPDAYERLSSSLAPSIWQLEDVKKGLLCQLFGGVSKALPSGKTRGEINVLLVGDPGVSKSQILSYVHKLAPRGIYTSGRGSSAVGLTAYVTRDPETRDMVLESGALVLSDRGICCIDEFDKMSDAARSVLHEVMEQQTISVAKAGIIATLNARTSVLACANPVGSRYNPSLSVVENIQLPPSLMSRFDLIYLMLDKADEPTDRRLARHLISLYGDPNALGAGTSAPVPIELLREYIAFARATCHPKLTPEAAQKLANAYADMRALGMSRKTISATPRQLESLIRLSEGSARIRLSEWVEEIDVVEAVRLMQVSMQQASIDPKTGQIDMDVIQTGVSAADRSARAHLAAMIRDVLGTKDSGNKGVRLADLMDTLASAGLRGITERDIENALHLELQGEFSLKSGVVTSVS
jgi:DNA replication licensing factor MCM4